MKATISEELIQVVSENQTKFSYDPLVSRYEDAMKMFDELIKKGFAKRRENNLLSITDTHLHRITLETYKTTPTPQRISTIGDDKPSINIKPKTNF